MKFDIRFPKFIKKILTRLLCPKNIYLEEIGCDKYPSNNYGGIDSLLELKRVIKSNRAYRKIGVDPRECWNLDGSFYLWLYSNLCQLLKDTNTDLSATVYQHNGNTYTEEEYIKYLMELLKQIINFDEFEGCPTLEWETIECEDKEGYLEFKDISSEEDKNKFLEVLNINYNKQTELENEIFIVFRDLFHSLWW